MHPDDHPNSHLPGILQGDHDALMALFAEEGARLYGVASALIAEKSAAQAAVVQLFAGLWGDPSSLQRPGMSLRGALTDGLRNIAADMIAAGAARRGEGPVDDMDLSDLPYVDETAEDLRVDSVLGVISPEDRAFLCGLWFSTSPFDGAGDRQRLRGLLQQIGPALDPRLRVHPGDDDGLLAGEYALDLLEPETRKVFEQRLAHDDALTATMGHWTEALGHLSREATPRQPPPAMRAKLLRQVRRRGVFRWLREQEFFWLVAGSIAASLVAYGALRLSGPSVPSGQELTGDAGLTYEAVYEPQPPRIILSRSTGDPGEGRTLHLSTGGGSSESLGPVGPEAFSVVTLPGAIPSGRNVTVEVRSADGVVLAKGTLRTP